MASGQRTIGAGGGIRIRPLLRGTNFKPVSLVLTYWYYARPSATSRRFSRQSKLGKTWSRHRSPSSFLHLLELFIFGLSDIKLFSAILPCFDASIRRDTSASTKRKQLGWNSDHRGSPDFWFRSGPAESFSPQIPDHRSP